MKQNRENVAKPNPVSVKPKLGKIFELPAWVAFIIFALTTTIFFWDQLSGTAHFWEDFARYVYPTQAFAAKEFAKNGIPFWNPYVFVGMPFLADLQAGFFYPLNRILSLFLSGDRLPASAVQFAAILHFFIAQSSMFYLAKRFKISTVGAIISSVSYAFSFLLVLHVIHPMILAHLAWFPLVFGMFYKGLTERKPRFAIGSGLIFGMSMLSGHPQLTLYEAFFLGIALIWLVATEIKTSGAKALDWKYILSAVAPFIIAVGIFQIQFLPAQTLAEQSRRNETTIERAGEGSLEFKQVLTSIQPKIFGYVQGDQAQKVQYYLEGTNQEGKVVKGMSYFYWETGYYFGLAALILGLFGMTVGYKDKFHAFLIGFTVFAMLFALGKNGFMLDIFHNLPFFKQFRNPGRMLFAALIAFSYFAGFGFDFLWKSEKNKATTIKLLVAVAIPLFFSLLTAGGLLPGLVGAPLDAVDILKEFGLPAALYTALIGALAYLVYKGKLNYTIAGLAIAIIAFIDLYSAGGDFNKSPQTIEEQYQVSDEFSNFKTSYLDEIFRVNTRSYSPSVMLMNSNQGAVSEIMTLEGYNPLVLKRNIPPTDKNGIHRLYNVKYEIAIDTLRRTPYIFERKDRMPRAWMVYSSETINSDEAIEKRMRNSQFDYDKKVIVEEALPFALNSADTSVKNSVKCLEYKSNEFKYEVSTDKNGVMCFSEIYYPDWKAYVDGAPAKIYRADYCFRAVALTAGKHVVEMRYESDDFKKGSLITMATLLLSVLGLVFLGDKKKA